MAHTSSPSLDFTSFFTDEDIVCRSAAAERDELILELLKRLAFNHGIGNVNQAYKAVVEREVSAPTVIADGIATPHARLDGIAAPLVAIATTGDGITFSTGAAPVKLVILILVPKDQPAIYLQILSSMSRICSDKGMPDEVSQLKTPKEVFRFFQRGGMVLPDCVCAGDIMVPNPVVLEEHDSLKSAIDLFVEKNLIAIPVIDKEKELVGVVTATALMRVCLPDYILWMDDLSPILNFEPFVNVLRNEENTWLSDIMSQEYASVQIGAPAISVAEEMMRRQVNQCYVARGKKLVGVITLQHFINKILRE